MKENIQHIAVVSMNRDKYSETFIHDSFDFFPSKKTLLYGGYLPTHFTDNWRKEGEPIRHVKVPFWKKKPPTVEAQNALNLYGWMAKNRPDVVLAHYGPSGVMVAPMCLKLGIPLIVHFHGYDAYREDILADYGLQYPALFQIAETISVSWEMTQQFKRLGLSEEMQHAFAYGVNPSKFLPKPLLEGPFRFLFIGRFVDKKAPDLLLEAFAKVREKVADVELEMVGDGELLDRCKQLSQDLGLGDAVTFRGILSRADVAIALADSHALVLPSRRTAEGDSEGTPLVILEAGAAMRPVIATHHGGIPAVIYDGKHGLLVKENDQEALAKAMIALVRNPQKAQRLAFALHRRVMAEFTQKAYHLNLWFVLTNAVRYP
jgi:colanic acid/amylovoran biosynthesis glycosyltransferase